MKSHRKHRLRPGSDRAALQIYLWHLLAVLGAITLCSTIWAALTQ